MPGPTHCTTQRPGRSSRPNSNGSKPGAPLGQHFLVDRQIEQRIVAALGANAAAVVLEIGAGPGNMTRLLAEQVAHLVSVEIDRELAAKLHTSFAGNERVEIIHRDFLQVSLAEIAARHGGAKFLVFGNLPYYITTPILMKLFESHHLIERILVMMQYEVAERIVAAPGDAEYGLLAVTAQFHAAPAILFKIPPGAFNPPPKVMSALVSLAIHPRASELGIANQPEFWKWMRAAFSQKRKTLVNNWKQLAPPGGTADCLARMALAPRVRAEELSLPQLAALHCQLCRYPGN